MFEKSGQSARPPLGREAKRDASTAFLDAWKTLRKRWLWVITLPILTVALAAFYTAGQVRIYSASCTLQIDPNPPRPLGTDVQAIVDVGTGSFWATSNYYNTQFKIIRSRAVAEETVRRLGLHQDVAFLEGKARPPATPTESREPRDVQGNIEQAAGLIRARLVVAPIRESRLVEVSYQDPNPERARQILSTLVNVYTDRNIDVALESTNTAAEWLEGQVQTLKTELEGTEATLHEYKKGNRILSISLDEQSNMIRQEMQQLSTALTAVKVRRAEVAAKAAELAGDSPDAGVDLANSDLLRDGVLRQLRDSRNGAVAEYDALIGAGKGEQHPLVASASARIVAAESALSKEVENVRRAARRDLAVVDREVADLTRLFEQAQQRALELGGLELDYRRLERSKVNTEKLYSLVIERSKESNLTRMMRFNNIQLIDPPLVPKSPVSPRIPLNMTIGLVGGLALGLFGAFAREMFDRSVKSPNDIEQELGLTFLGLLPRVGRNMGQSYGKYAGNKAAGGERRRRAREGAEPQRIELIVHEDPQSSISEASRGLRTNVSFMSPDKPYKSLLVTSASPNEGKTTVACCLAVAMAQAGHKVVLIDCDLRRPRLHRVFQKTNDRGVTSSLVDRTGLDSAVVETEVPGLFLLASGPSCPNPAESLQSNAFQSLLEELGAKFDRIVIDSPPIAPVTDAVILSTRVDASIMVIRALSTTRDAVLHARRALEDVRANLIGAVLNAADPGRADYPHYYRYYGGRDAEVARTAGR
jgi:succinoglycan biosynthesis transport protein ExoP